MYNSGLYAYIITDDVLYTILIMTYIHSKMEIVQNVLYAAINTNVTSTTFNVAIVNLKATCSIVLNHVTSHPCFRQENMKLIWGYQGTYEGWGWNVTHMADFPENLALFPPHMQTPANQNARNGALMGMRNFDIDEYGNITIPGVSALFDLAGKQKQ